MRILQDEKLDFNDVLLVPQRSTLISRKDVILERSFRFYHSPKTWSGTPIICSNMYNTGSLAMAKALKEWRMITCLHKYHSIEQLVSVLSRECDDNSYIWPSIGFKDADITKLKMLREGLNNGFNICIDVPNGHLEVFVDFCAKVRNEFPESIIMAGNVTTPEMTQELIIHGGVDIIKTQIGPGSMCKTRMVTGVGYGSLSCVIECSGAAHGLKNGEKKLGLICSDGGCRETGDINKAFGGGADFVMLGGMFAGYEENDGEWKEKDTYTFEGSLWDGQHIATRKKYLKFYGMSTHHAQQQHGNGIKTYRASEGDVREIECKGKVDDGIQEMLGGIRSCCTYIGANSIKDMNKCAVFAKISRIHTKF